MSEALDRLIKRLCWDIECLNEKHTNKNGYVLLSQGTVNNMKDLANQIMEGMQ